jgi:hypothetical protein
VIILIFVLGAVSSVLAHDSAHSVPGITLPPGDANLSFSLLCSGLALAAKKRLVFCREVRSWLHDAVDSFVSRLDFVSAVASRSRI